MLYGWEHMNQIGVVGTGTMGSRTLVQLFRINKGHTV
jgi:3-hydroxyacyl-CoA dehydrogenase